MNKDQREAWKGALAAKAAAGRRQSYRPRPRGLHAVKGAGMGRIPPPASERPATRTAGHHHRKGKP